MVLGHFAGYPRAQASYVPLAPVRLIRLLTKRAMPLGLFLAGLGFGAAAGVANAAAVDFSRLDAAPAPKVILANAGPPEVTEERREVLLNIVRENDCRVREFTNDPKVVEALSKTEMDHRELRAVSESLVADGTLKRWGDVLILRDGSCS